MSDPFQDAWNASPNAPQEPSKSLSGLVVQPHPYRGTEEVDNWETKHFNFGGIRKPGVIAGPSQGGFREYGSAEEGVADIGRLLRSYQKRGLNTIEGIVSRWAPPNENPTDQLIARASKTLGVDPKAPIDLDDPKIMAKMIEATIRNEQGGKLPVSPDVISKVTGALDWYMPVAPNASEKVDKSALEHERKIPGSRIYGDVDFDSILDRLPDDSDTTANGGRAKAKSLRDSVLGKGESIMDLPHIDVSVDKEGNAKIVDYDGLHRLKLLKEMGYDVGPVAIRGIPEGTQVKNLEGMRGERMPFKYAELPKPPPPEPSKLDRLGTGVADVGYGAMQFGARVPVMGEGAAFLPPEAQEANDPAAIAKAVDQQIASREKAIEADRAARGETGTDWWRVGGNALATLPLGMMPGAGAVGVGGNALARAGGAVLGGMLAGGAGAAVEPVTSGAYGPAKAGQIAEGVGLGGALGAVPAVGGAIRSAVGRMVSPKTITEAASRLFGEKAEALTEGKIADIKDRLAAGFERIEKSHDIDLTKDPKIIPELDLVKSDARAMLGDPNYGGRAGPVLSAVKKFLSLADDQGIIPGKSAATLWHEGGAVDLLTQSGDPSIRQFGQRIKNTARDAFSRALPPDDASVYSAFRSQWRDMKIVEKAIPTGEHQVRPRQFVQAVRRRFPNEKEMRTPPAIVKLARAVGETWPMGDTNHLAARTAARTARALAAGAFGHLLGGPIGGGIGLAGELAVEKLARNTRFASRNALATLRPPSPPPSNPMLNLLRPAIRQAPNALAAPLGAAVAAP